MRSSSPLVDIQVNGYAGVDFNADDMSDEDFAAACNELHLSGVAQFLPTVITAPISTMVARIERIVRAVESNSDLQQLVAGIHVEGPFINAETGYVGTHPADAVQAANTDDAARLIDAGQGLVKLLTLAPECDPGFATTKWLADRNIVVSAGHCDPSLEQLCAAVDNGLTMFTHLGNGCPLQMHRHDNIIQRVLSISDRLWTCFIADGVHVPFVALGNYLRLVGAGRAIVTSDAISAAGKGQGIYSLGGQQVRVDEQLATWSVDGGHLMGSATPLSQARQNLIDQLGLTPAEADQLTSTNPRRALRLG